MSEALSDERLSEIDARCAAATPGPWAVDLDQPFTLGGDTVSVDAMTRDGLCVEREVCTCILDTDDWPDGPEWLEDAANARFIACARSDVPALLAEVRRLRAVERELRGHVRALVDRVESLLADRSVDGRG